MMKIQILEFLSEHEDGSEQLFRWSEKQSLPSLRSLPGLCSCDFFLPNEEGPPQAWLGQRFKVHNMWVKVIWEAAAAGGKETPQEADREGLIA